MPMLMRPSTMIANADPTAYLQRRQVEIGSFLGITNSTILK